MNQPKKIQVTEDLELANFNWEFSAINYTKGMKTVSIDVQMEKDGALNVRTFEIPIPKAWDEESINAELLKLPAFKGSN